ncbi:MAG: aspartate/glutamate racemase family protein [Candidatus Nomurabacteria bacterium]|jgi:glutamate racemase|nr:aspartate/glutamate racemase family protein [Candidatus Nomurabacteria bacterium]
MKIGVFDTGKGGELVAERLKKLRPHDELLVVNDRAHFPYGGRTPVEICRLTEQAIQPLLQTCEIILLACNTATVNAAAWLRKTHPDVKFIGFEPMIKPAAKIGQNIVILATSSTLRSARYRHLKTQFADCRNIFEPDCSGWATKIERGNFDDAELVELENLAKSRPIDVIVLGCTHYLALEKRLIEKFPGVKILQPIAAVNARIERISRSAQA